MIYKIEIMFRVQQIFYSKFLKALSLKKKKRKGKGKERNNINKEGKEIKKKTKIKQIDCLNIIVLNLDIQNANKLDMQFTLSMNR